MWKIMARAYPQRFRQLSPAYCLDIRSPKLPVKLYMDMMNNGPCNWHAVLGLSSYYATVTDLVAIGNMKNLVALDIYALGRSDRKPDDIDEDYGCGLDDRIVRSWVEVAESSGSLQHLRMLRIFNQPQLTTQALWMLERLPHLQLVVIGQCDAFTKEMKQSTKGNKGAVQLGGWVARRLNSPGNENEACRIDTQLNAYRSLLGTEHGSSRIPGRSFTEKGSEQQEPKQAPILQFALSTPSQANDPERMRALAYNKAAEFVFLTRAPFHEKKRAPPEAIPKNQNKRVMKDRGVRDMGDILSDFL